MSSRRATADQRRPLRLCQGLIDALLERRLDLAFVSLPGPRPKKITLTDLTTSVLDLVVPADHPLA
ncbi:LysR substrate-binding domain-containing protein [Streptomyces sp. NPDC055722]